MTLSGSVSIFSLQCASEMKPRSGFSIALGFISFCFTLLSSSATDIHGGKQKGVNPIYKIILTPKKYWEQAAVEDAHEREGFSLENLWNEGRSSDIQPEVNAEWKGTEKPVYGLASDTWINRGPIEKKVLQDVETELAKEVPDLLRQTKPHDVAKMCNMTINGHVSCLDVKECTEERIKHYYVKYKTVHCKKENGEVGICCPDIETVERPKRQAEDNRIDVTEEVDEPSGNIDYNKLGEPEKCGFSSKSLRRVANGQEARARDYPWIVAILTRPDWYFFCGGAVISKKHILTAAHCLPDVEPHELYVRVGEYDFLRYNDSRSKDHTIVSIVRHEDYDPGTMENDIALLTVKGEIEFNEYVNPICLPPLEDHFYEVNRTSVVAGWGSTEYGGETTDVLREVTIPIWDQKHCRLSFSQRIFDTNVCAGGYSGGKDSCQGDSGGPLVVQRDDGRWTSIGIISWGIRCGEAGLPGVYTRLNKYLHWLAPLISKV